MTGEQLEAAWRWAREPVPAVVVGVWAAVALLVALFVVRFRKDWRAGVKAGVALVAASLALGCLVSRARSESPEEFRYVDQVVANPEVMRGRRLAVCGHVACGSIERRRGTRSYRFKIQGLQPQTNVVLEARYTGPARDIQTGAAGRRAREAGRPPRV